MDTEFAKLQIVLILTVGLGLASVLGYLTYRLGLSPLLGYLLAGYAIGPYSPGFVADSATAEQLAEIGVVLMMFGVGLNFRIEELIGVRRIALPGALIQTITTTAVAAWFITLTGWPLATGIIFGLGIGVASTVVMVKMLQDHKLLNTEGGHISLGWLVVEDLITVILLLLIPEILPFLKGDETASFSEVLINTSWLILKVIVIKVLFFSITIFTIGQKIAAYLLLKIKETNSKELFTLSILAMTFVIATGSTYLLGTSIALGAFIAGMIIGRTQMRQQAIKHSLAIRDAFVVIFFVSVGMIFNPLAITLHPYLFFSVLLLIVVFKPLIAFLIMLCYKYPFKSCLTVALALGQIGEFSFILSEEAIKYKLMPDDGYDVIVACALISIALNPILFKNRFLSEEKIGPALE